MFYIIQQVRGFGKEGENGALNPTEIIGTGIKTHLITATFNNPTIIRI